MNYELFFPLHFPAFASIIILMSSRYTAYPQYQPPLTKMHPLVPRHLLPINLLKICEADARSAQKTPAGTVNNIRPCTLFTYTFAMQTCYCIEPPPSVAVLIRRGLFAVAARMPLVYIRSDVSAAAETHSQNYTRMYSFGDATTQICCIFAKGA